MNLNTVSGMQDLIKVISGVLNQANMGSQVNDWLFGSLMILIFAMTYGTHWQWAVSSAFNSLNSGSLGNALLTLLGQNSAQPPVPTALTPISGDLSKSHSAVYAGTPPGWLLLLGALIWAVFVLIGLFEIFGETHSTRLREWKNEGVFWWMMAPVSIVIFIGSPLILQIIAKTIYDPIISKIITGVASSIGADPKKTLADPLWLLLALFGVATPSGADPTAIAFNSIAGILTHLQDLQLNSAKDVFQILPYLIRHVLSPSIFLELVLLLGLFLIIVQSASALLWINFLPFTTLSVAVNPFSPKGIYRWLLNVLKSISALAIVVIYDSAIAFIGGNGNTPNWLTVTSVPRAIFNGVITYAVVCLLWFFWTKPLLIQVTEQSMRLINALHEGGDALENGGNQIGSSVSLSGKVMSAASRIPFLPQGLSERMALRGDDLEATGQQISDWTQANARRLRSINLPWANSQGLKTNSMANEKSSLRLGDLKSNPGELNTGDFPLGASMDNADSVISSGIHYTSPQSQNASSFRLQAQTGEDANELSNLFHSAGIPHTEQSIGGEHWLNFAQLSAEEAARAKKLVLSNRDLLKETVSHLEAEQRETMSFEATSLETAHSIQNYLKLCSVKSTLSGNSVTFPSAQLETVQHMLDKANRGELLLIEKRGPKYFVRKNGIPVEIAIDQFDEGKYLIIS